MIAAAMLLQGAAQNARVWAPNVFNLHHINVEEEEKPCLWEMMFIYNYFAAVDNAALESISAVGLDYPWLG